MADLRSKYLKRHTAPAYLPINPDKVGDNWAPEGKDHPRLICRAMTNADLDAIVSEDLGQICDTIDRLTVRFEGEWGLIDTVVPVPEGDVKMLLHQGLTVPDINDVTEQATKANLPNAQEGKS